MQDNDLYVLTLADGQVQRLTTDGGETVFNGSLDWVYNEELATRAAQPAYAWSPDGIWLIYLRLDESAVHNDPVTDYRPVPATVSYTRYPTAGTANPVATLHALAQGAIAPPLEVPLPDDAEYVLPFFTWTPDSNHALYITVNRDHTELILNMWTPQSGELRDPDQGKRTRTGSTRIAMRRPIFLGDGARRWQFLWLSERDGFMHLYLYDAGRHAGAAIDPGRLDDRLLGVEPAHPGPAGPRGPDGDLGVLHHHAKQPARAPDLSRQHRHRRAASRSRSSQDSTSRRCPATAATWWTSSPTSTRRRSRGS